LGRDLRAIEALQQRLVESQQALERDYWQMRQVETRYRLLFQQVADPVLIAEADSLRVIDANPAAAALLGPRPASGWTLDAAFDPSSRAELEEHLTVVRSQGSARDIRLPLRTVGADVIVRAALMPLEKTGHYLVQLVPVRGSEPATDGPGGAALSVLDAQPDAFVLVADDGRVLHANRAFLDLAQVASVEQVRGKAISEWVGRPGADAEGVLTLLRNHGSVRLFSTALRGTLGGVAEIEASGARVTGADGPVNGLVLRDVGRRLAAGPHGARDLTLAVEQLTALVGRVSLRDLVRDTTALVERHFIEAALELSEQNRTTAAQILGVSRQSLYVKLRRFGGTKAAAPKRGRRAGTKTTKTKRPRK
jgi:transcriptional regulator PpsR